MKKILTIDEAKKVFAELKAKTIVATNGCFDILHIGHSRYLSQSRALGDLLVVGLNSDTSVTKLKGPTRPINSQDDRAELLLALRAVDYVVIFSEDDASKFLEAVKPQIYTKGGDYDLETLPEAKTAKALGTKIVLVELVPDKSTSSTVKRINDN
jgi:glycerol-3-phosphate cytidylyltransferase